MTVAPGEQHATRDATVISTLLGSCVAVCLYDEAGKVAGMNHFLLANRRYARSLPLTATEAGRYGLHAMELLINDMMKLGASRARLRAKVFGGAAVIGVQGRDNFLCVGEVNQRFIREYLATEGMPVMASDLGGEQGRIIHFHTDTFQVFRRFIPRAQSERLVREEREFWEESILRNESPDSGKVTLFS
ncbi:MAG TPA: chemotaxis protein CheD [Rectinemataceae bacterium]|nr:chemotaxis protein CheD [Rectinemataceae bacterium]